MSAPADASDATTQPELHHAVSAVDAVVFSAANFAELIAVVGAVETRAQQARATLVAVMRRSGWTWSDVGKAFGISHQAARKRYGRPDDQ